MAILVNAYCTSRNVPAPTFPHKITGRRDRADPQLAEHLMGFTGFLSRGGAREMTQTLYHVLMHVQRVRNHLGLSVEEDQLDDLEEWAAGANAILFLPDNTVRDPAGRVLVDPDSGAAEAGAQVPYPKDARARKARSEEQLSALGIRTPATLPPVIGEDEVDVRAADDVAGRALSLLVVAVRGESLSSGSAIPTEDLRRKLPLGFAGLTPQEAAFVLRGSPSPEDLARFTWRYEALALLEWALTLVPELPFPDRICDVAPLAQNIFEPGEEKVIEGARLRATGELLDALDLHFRLHWACRQAHLDSQPLPASLDPGVVLERHQALNWLTTFENAEWDEVDTPT